MNRQLIGGIYTVSMLASGYLLQFLPLQLVILCIIAIGIINAFVFNQVVWRRSTIIDKLTGVYNREALDHQIGIYRKKYVSVLMIDIDNFKSINDTFGHAAGDRVLKEIGSLLKNHIREADVYRYGGEEFTIILPGESYRSAYDIAERLRKAVETYVSIEGREVTVSIGVASSKSITQAMKLSDECLYLSKQMGKNRTSVSVN